MDNQKYLLKGCEVEQYIGSSITTEYIPASHIISGLNNRFSVEPDARNIEYITSPTHSYDELLQQLVKGRIELRETIKKHNPEWTILPGSSMGSNIDRQFHRSKPDNPYHGHIEERHDINIITASFHYNVGLSHLSQDEIIRISNLLQIEASLILSMTASSPFYDGKVSQALSDRWLRFPKVPEHMPFWSSHQNYKDWNERMVKEEQMYNYRHLWSAVRPNGEKKPDEVDRIEVRIADNSTHWSTVMGVMAWVELRAHEFINDPELIVPSHDVDLITLTEVNEQSAAIYGLSGHFSDWLYGQEYTHYEAIYRRLEDCSHLIDKHNLSEYIKGLENILQNGNEATQKLNKYNDDHMSIKDIMLEWIEEIENEDAQMQAKLGITM